MNEQNIGIEGFYAKCSEILESPNVYTPRPFRKRTRWNNRGAGNGRFEGYGLIRVFGLNLIHISLKHPRTINEKFASFEDALAFLEGIVDESEPHAPSNP